MSIKLNENNNKLKLKYFKSYIIITFFKRFCQGLKLVRLQY